MDVAQPSNGSLRVFVLFKYALDGVSKGGCSDTSKLECRACHRHVTIRKEHMLEWIHDVIGWPLVFVNECPFNMQWHTGSARCISEAHCSSKTNLKKKNKEAESAHSKEYDCAQ